MKIIITAVASVFMELAIKLSVIHVEFVGIFRVDRAIKRENFF